VGREASTARAGASCDRRRPARLRLARSRLASRRSSPCSPPSRMQWDSPRCGPRVSTGDASSSPLGLCFGLRIRRGREELQEGVGGAAMPGAERPHFVYWYLVLIVSNPHPPNARTIPSSTAIFLSSIVAVSYWINKMLCVGIFPPISQPEGRPLTIQDAIGKEWHFQFRFWPNNISRMYVLEGVIPCILSLQLQAGDTGN
jgi:hypothetical protein